jgi:eukaryotic-like serine/threonine-protein kinase
VQAFTRIAELLSLGRWLPLATTRAGRSIELSPGVYLTRGLRLLRPLGSSGRVWVAHHLGLKLEVVVKFLGTAPTSTEPRDPQRDAIALGALKDPHIVQALDHGGERAGLPFVVMELLAGESLRERVQRAGPLGLREVRTILAQTAGALGKVHASGVVHGQLTLENLFQTDAAGEPFIKILGFKHPPEVRRPGVMPTPTFAPDARFSSPEQLLRKAPADPQSDLWALGVAIYELLTASAPFVASTPEALVMAVCHGPLRPITRLRPDLPHAMDAWFARALSKDRSHRYRTASEFAQSFAEAADGHYFVDPDRSALPDDEDDQEEPTALWTQPAWWHDEAQALGQQRASAPFMASRSAPTMVLRIPPAVLASSAPPTQLTAPPPSQDRPILFPLFAIAVGTMVGLSGALLVWGSDFWSSHPRSGVEMEADGALRTNAATDAPTLSDKSGTNVRSSALQPSEPPTATVQAETVVIDAPDPRSTILASEPRKRPAATPRATPPRAAAPRAAAQSTATRAGAPPAAKAPAQKAAPAAAPTPTKRAGNRKGGECDPPYYYDENRIKRVKYQCL